MSDKQGIVHHTLAEGAEPEVLFEADAPPMQVRTGGGANERTVGGPDTLTVVLLLAWLSSELYASGL